MEFLQQIVKGEKKFLYKQQVSEYEAKVCTELSLENCFPEAMKHPTMHLYWPSSWKGDKRTDRAFFWNIMYSEAPQYVEFIEQEAERVREENLRKKGLDLPKTQIQVSDQFANILLSNIERFNPSKFADHI
jgi:hypothetical protein